MEEIMAKDYQVRKATHAGRGHLLSFINNQDSLALFDGEINGQHIIIGIVSDGCSGADEEKKDMHTEIGSRLTSTFLVHEAVMLLKQGVATSVVPSLLYPDLLRFLGRTLNEYSFTDQTDKAAFIQHHLLATVVGFITSDEIIVVFYTGDGTIVINDQVDFIDSDDHPLYPAYHLVDRSALQTSTPLPTGFETSIYLTDTITRLAIGSDAWKHESELINDIWGFKNPAGLQRRLNVWSKNDKRFYDDVTLITVEMLIKEDVDGGSS